LRLSQTASLNNRSLPIRYFSDVSLKHGAAEKRTLLEKQTLMAIPTHIAPPIFYQLDACPIRHVLQPHLGKWPILVLTHLSFGQHRFTQLLNGIPDISQRMLTQTLRNLEKDGLISRHVTASIPLRVDYDLTALGGTILPTLEGLLAWGATNRVKIEQNREDYEKLAAIKAAPVAKSA